MWKVEPIEGKDSDTLRLTLTSPDGDQGFPGKLDVTVDYTWNDDCELGVHYMAVTDKPTLCNMTNHAYFNLDGHDAGTVENLTLQINADCVTEADPALIPTGRLLPLKGPTTSPRKSGWATCWPEPPWIPSCGTRAEWTSTTARAGTGRPS